MRAWLNYYKFYSSVRTNWQEHQPYTGGPYSPTPTQSLNIQAFTTHLFRQHTLTQPQQQHQPDYSLTPSRLTHAPAVYRQSSLEVLSPRLPCLLVIPYFQCEIRQRVVNYVYLFLLLPDYVIPSGLYKVEFMSILKGNISMAFGDGCTFLSHSCHGWWMEEDKETTYTR